MTDESLPPGPDSGIVGISVDLLGAFDPHRLAETLGKEVIFAGRKGEPRPRRSNGPERYPSDYLRLGLDEDLGIGQAIGELVAAVSALDDASRLEWDRLECRTIRLGLSTCPGSMVTGHEIERSTVEQMAAIGADLIVTVYNIPQSDAE